MSIDLVMVIILHYPAERLCNVIAHRLSSLERKCATLAQPCSINVYLLGKPHIKTPVQRSSTYVPDYNIPSSKSHVPVYRPYPFSRILRQDRSEVSVTHEQVLDSFPQPDNCLLPLALALILTAVISAIR